MPYGMILASKRGYTLFLLIRLQNKIIKVEIEKKRKAKTRHLPNYNPLSDQGSTFPSEVATCERNHSKSTQTEMRLDLAASFGLYGCGGNIEAGSQHWLCNTYSMNRKVILGGLQSQQRTKT